MIKLLLTLAALVLSLALPAAYAVASKPAPRTVADTLLRRMNSGPNGTITRRVTCERETRARRTFVCELASVRATTIDVRVALADGGLRTTWHPLEG